MSLSHKSWSDKEELWSNKDDYTHKHIKGNMVGDKDFLGVTNSYVNGSSTDKGNSSKMTATLDNPLRIQLLKSWS